VKELKASLELPVIMAPMFLISNPNMVIKACKSGIIGSFPALNARSNMILEDWMKQISTELASQKKENPDKKIGPWAVNFISHKTNKRFEEDLKLIQKYQPPIVISSLGDPSRVVDVVHQYGGIVFSDVINIIFAKKAIEKGSDGLILVSNGAGGHAGDLNPFAFIREVREFWNGPIALAGSLSSGEDILATEIVGANFAYMGSRFIASEESEAVEGYKNMVMDSGIEDIVYTDAFSGIKGNYLIPSIKNLGLDPNNLKKKSEVSFTSTNKTKAWKDIWGAGQGIGSIKKVQSIPEIITELKTSYRNAQESMVKL
jgi:nitronate monooxygenase